MLPASVVPELVLNEFKRDGKPADKKDPSDRVRVKVEFVKEWKADEAAPAEAPKDNAAANPGQTAENKQIQPGVTMYLPADVAEKLVTDGIAKYDVSDPEKSRLYDRPLRDYARLFRNAYAARNLLFNRVAELTAHTELVEDAVAKVTEDVAEAEKMKAGLTKDLTKFKEEVAVTVSFNEALAAKLKNTMAELSQLFRGNLRMSGELAQVQQQLIDAIRRHAPAPDASAAVAPR